jgi:hypothetical protein
LYVIPAKEGIHKLKRSEQESEIVLMEEDKVDGEINILSITNCKNEKQTTNSRSQLK